MPTSDDSATFDLRVTRLSAPRMASYLYAAKNDRRRALGLYEWNVAASGALYEALAVVEVVVRNAIHSQLTAWHEREQRPGTWMDDPLGILAKRATDDIARATERAQAWRRVRGSWQPTRPHPPVGAVVAELSFGFWRYLLASRYEHTLWLAAIRHGFPHVHGKRTVVDVPLRRLHELRNRIAHLEPIISRRLERDEADIDAVIRAVCPRTAEWAASLRRINTLRAAKP